MSIALGHPISQLKHGMSYAEMQTYRAYTNKYGPLSVARMHDRPAALIAYIISKVNGNDPKFSDFMPFGKKDDYNDQ